MIMLTEVTYSQHFDNVTSNEVVSTTQTERNPKCLELHVE